MSKSKMLSKFNLKDYNNELEMVLEKKVFSSDAKNLLLSMLYRIEVSYKDYKTVKRDVTSKEGFIETIINTIENECEKIEFVKPKDGITENFSIINEEKKIICYQNEVSLFEALLCLSKKYFYIEEEYGNLKLPMQDLLRKGYMEDKLEIITDFDGWSWNPRNKRMYDNIYAYCYQVLRILKGNSFLYEWKRDRRTKRNYLLELRKYSENLYVSIYKIALLLYAKEKEQKDKIIETRKIFETELAKMDNKKEYLKEIYDNKKDISNKIKKYDQIINSKELLLKEFSRRNNDLPDNKKIFSISDLAEILQKEREEKITQMQEVTALADPKNYIEKAKKLKDKLELIQEVEKEFTSKEQIDQAIANEKKELEEIFWSCLKYELEGAENKKELQEMLYNYRYGIYLEGYDISLQEKLACDIITKACKLKVVTIVHEDIEYNCDIIKKTINNSIIEMEKMMIVLKKEKVEDSESQNSILAIEIFDDETFDRIEKINLKKEKGFMVKFGKKIKLLE